MHGIDTRHSGGSCCGTWENIVLAAQPAHGTTDESPWDGSSGATVLTVERSPTTAAPRKGPLVLLSVHEPVDDLCKKAARLCAPEEMLGDCGGAPVVS